MNILIGGIPGNTANYEKALSRCHVSFETSLHPLNISSYDKLLLPGGGDIHPSWFGQPDQGSVSPDRELDLAQFALLHAFILDGKPILGICRGLQIINVYFGGSLVQNLPSADTHRYQEQDQIHPVSNTPSSLFSCLYQSSCLVNSAHHQGCDMIGRELTIIQRANDGVVEALAHETKPVLGVQWHPERTSLLSQQADIADGGLLIRYFAEQM